ncbi:MAG: D-glycero-beta-D-manno-heptose 1,7-bisphosphate 7-phosphatase [Gammaproteobacteria bacterium]|nr:D-glycero-beta-D-manno-heptose 1,7-bisphosphate 7-phosphatase [Gammaproteobacteria bacterium]
MARLILLDRDGVINFDSPDYIKSADEWRPIPGSLEAIATLRSHGAKVAVCTNQAGIARGRFSSADLAAIHAKLNSALAALDTRLDALTFCPHHPDDACDCRKPKPGMLLAMMREFAAEPAQTVFVGDSLRDLQAAHAAGCQAVLVRTGSGKETEPRARAKGLTFEAFDDLAGWARGVAG